jgi:hypothetical protein
MRVGKKVILADAVATLGVWGKDAEAASKRSLAGVRGAADHFVYRELESRNRRERQKRERGGKR